VTVAVSVARPSVFWGQETVNALTLAQGAKEPSIGYPIMRMEFVGTLVLPHGEMHVLKADLLSIFDKF
jgi:hypothetical protein